MSRALTDVIVGAFAVASLAAKAMAAATVSDCAFVNPRSPPQASSSAFATAAGAKWTPSSPESTLPRRTTMASSLLSSSATETAETERAKGATATATVERKKTLKGKGGGSWFPVRPSDALPFSSSSSSDGNGNEEGGDGYDAVVRSAYLRHVSLMTEGAADLAMSTYLRGGLSGGESEAAADPFGALATDLSACPHSKDEGGKIGWVDNPAYSGSYTSSVDGSAVGSMNEAIHGMLPPDVVDKVFQSRPKGGDVLKLESESTGMWHLVRVDDLMVDYVPDTARNNAGVKSEEGKVGSQRGTNRVITNRGKLKGSGVTPVSPRIVRNDSDDNTDDLVAKTYHISTTGCQMNVADSERIEGVLSRTLNLSPSPSSSDADVVVLNTCTIRDHAESKVYDALGPHAARKRRGERVALVVAGCVAQQEGEALLRRVPEVDLVVGPQYVGRMDELLEGVGMGHQIVATDPSLITEDLSRPVRGHGVRGWVNVIYGCNEHCTYCVVPGVRGVEQSRSMEAILQECLGLAEEGYKEVTLLGQNIDAYGRDMVPRRTFADLLHYLNDNLPPNTIERVRYVTSHPRYFSDRVIDAVANLDKVCECFHVPFQSGDNGVLKDMRRGYTFESYMRIIQKIRKEAPDASICGDVIVGFPGESDEAFQRTLDLMEEVKFDNLNTFAYSPRPNTEAALWDDLQIPDDVKSERLQIVQRLATKHALERSERYVGRVEEVLVEDRNPKNVDQVVGRTRQGRQVYFDGTLEELRGSLVRVKIENARPWSLEGAMVVG